jgi:SAM-dependent methyltransferase
MMQNQKLLKQLGRIWYGFPVVRLPKRLISRAQLCRRLQAPGLKLVNFGAGSHRIKGWINADISPSAEYYIDAREVLPFKTETLDAIFSEHFIEHLEYQDAINWVAECYRCLKPGGVFRVSTPGLEQIIAMYSGKSPYVNRDTVIKRHFSRFAPEVADTYGPSCRQHPCIMANDKLRLWGNHRFIFDQDLLTWVLKDQGFSDIHSADYGESSLPYMRDLERHAGNEEWMKQAECFILEARKRPLAI